MSCRWAWCPGVGLWLVVAVLAPKTARAQNDSRNTAMEILCLTDRPAIDQGASTRLQAWAATPDGQPIAQPIALQWQVTAGVVQGTGSDVQWNLSGVKIESGEFHKKATATVKATATGLEESGCVVEVFVGKTEEQKARYLKTLESCLLVMESVEDHIQIHRPPSELNITHIPVKEIPKYSQVSAEWAANTLDVYDYATAQKLLDKLDKSYQQGPYLISVGKKSLSDMATPVQAHVLQDFTGKVPELASNVVELFTYRAAQQRTWSDESLRSFVLNMRNLIAVAGKVTPDVASAVIKLVQLQQQLK